MSLKFKYDQRKDEAAKSGENSSPEGDVEFHSTPNHPRNICFHQKDGKRQFFNYTYLIYGEYSPEENSISLIFTTHIIELKGQGLEPLFDELMEHAPKHLKISEERYQALKEGEGMILEINVRKGEN